MASVDWNTPLIDLCDQSAPLMPAIPLRSWLVALAFSLTVYATLAATIYLISQ